jgi:ABC-2 type transport system ATP-binding protein
MDHQSVTSAGESAIPAIGQSGVASSPMIVARGLGRQFAGVWAIRDLSFSLSRGEVFGILGPNGAGKTTTIRMLAALIAPSAGTASIDGLDVVSDAMEVRARIGLLTETPGLYERLSSVENLDFFGRIQGIPGDVRAGRIDRLLQLFELTDRRDDLVGTFSKGMKQKLAIARALLHEPAVLFFDEPTAGLDPEAAFIVREAIANLKSAGRTIVLSTHNLDEAQRLCDRVAFVRGEILRVDSPARLRAGAGTTAVEVALGDGPTSSLEVRIRSLPGVRSVTAEGSGMRVEVEDVRRDMPGLVRALAATGVDVLGVTPTAATLESVYFEVMGTPPPLDRGIQ